MNETVKDASIIEPLAKGPSAGRLLASIILVTFNRPDSLVRTLESMRALKVPTGAEVELIVLDNASTDNTAQVIQGFAMDNLKLVYVYEGRKGKCNALNRGLEVAQGEILLWTDDDVLVPRDWIGVMCAPLLSGEADGVAGQVRLAPHLQRPWMTESHFSRLADTRFFPDPPIQMLGSNMAFHRRVLSKVPAYDVELGPGALGFSDDTLFSFQMLEAGFKIVSSPATAEHHPDPSRLLRSSWINHGKTTGRSAAYTHHHWYHQSVRLPRVKLFLKKMELWLYRFLNRRNISEESCNEKEIGIVQTVSFLEKYLIEREKPRVYLFKATKLKI